MSEEIYKVVLVGEMKVGKTCIISQFTKGVFDPNTVTSFTAQFSRKIMEFPEGKKIVFDVWDTAGQERYRALAKVFYKNAKAVILVYDITNYDTFKVMKEYWYHQVKENNTEDAIFAVAGNKNDLYEERKVEDKEGEEFAKSIGAIFASTSAKNDHGITALFENIGKKILDPNFGKELNDLSLSKSFKINPNDDDTDQNPKNGCCSFL